MQITVGWNRKNFGGPTVRDAIAAAAAYLGRHKTKSLYTIVVNLKKEGCSHKGKSTH